MDQAMRRFLLGLIFLGQAWSVIVLAYWEWQVLNAVLESFYWGLITSCFARPTETAAAKTRMNGQSWNGETNVIVNRRTAVFVTRDRAQGQPAYDNSRL